MSIDQVYEGSLSGGGLKYRWAASNYWRSRGLGLTFLSSANEPLSHITVAGPDQLGSYAEDVFNDFGEAVTETEFWGLDTIRPSNDEHQHRLRDVQTALESQEAAMEAMDAGDFGAAQAISAQALKDISQGMPRYMQGLKPSFSRYKIETEIEFYRNYRDNRASFDAGKLAGEIFECAVNAKAIKDNGRFTMPPQKSVTFPITGEEAGPEDYCRIAGFAEPAGRS